jgi:hypothetical protein
LMTLGSCFECFIVQGCLDVSMQFKAYDMWRCFKIIKFWITAWATRWKLPTHQWIEHLFEATDKYVTITKLVCSG